MDLTHGEVNKGHNKKAWLTDKEKADAYWPQLVKIIRQVAGHIIEIREATPEEDKYSATDYVVTVTGGDICCRVRLNWKYWLKHGDVTIRHSRPSGAKTERQKLVEGFGRWYLYTWSKPDKQIGAWVFIDLDTVRQHRILERDWPIISNKDGSSELIAVDLGTFQQCGSIVTAGGEAIARLHLLSIPQPEQLELV